MITPITPKEAKESKYTVIPDAIIEAVNNLIVTNIDLNGCANVKGKDIITLACSNDENLTAELIYKHKWLDIESLFISYGWKVAYDKAGYNEKHYDTFFTFKPNN